jgi:hypothetical protein
VQEYDVLAPLCRLFRYLGGFGEALARALMFTFVKTVQQGAATQVKQIFTVVQNGVRQGQNAICALILTVLMNDIYASSQEPLTALPACS